MTGFDTPFAPPEPPEPLPLLQPPDAIERHPAYLAETARLQQGEEERKATFLANYRLSLKSNPKLVGEAQQIAARIGEPPDAVESNIAVAREVARQREVRDRELWRTHPLLMQTLQDRQFLRLAHDDLDNLAATDSVFAMMGRKWASGQATNERGYIGARMAAGLSTPQDKDRLAELDEIIGNAQRDTGFVASTTEVLGQMAGTIPQALAAGGALALPASLGGPFGAGAAFSVGFGSAVFAQSALIEGGSTYLALMKMPGMDEDQAAAMALGVGLVNGALELVGAKVVAKPFQLAAKAVGQRVVGGLVKETAGAALTTFVKEYAKGVGAEVGTEVLQEVTNIVAEAVARPDGQPEPSWADIRGRLGDIFVKTAEGMSVLALPGPAAHFASMSQKAAEATQRAEAFQRQVELAAESKVRENHPGQHESYVQRVAEASKNADLYVDSPAFVKAMETAGVTRADLQAKEPELFQQLEKAEEHSDIQMDVVIRNAAFQARLAKTKFGDALMEHVRHDPDGLSMAEAQEWIAQQQKLAKEAGSLVTEKRENDKDFADSARRVEDALYEQIRATKRLPNAKQERAAAQFYRDFVVTQAAKRGLTPEQFYERYPLRVVRGDGQQAAAFDQLRTDTPEFQAWFGDSKVVDAQGKPLVVYHGTPDIRGIRDSGVFQTREEQATQFLTADAAASAKLERAYFFSSRREAATSYADDRRAFDYQGAEPGVVDAYVALRNPMIVDAQGREWRDVQKLGKTRSLTREARDAGHDGVIIRNVRDNYENTKATKPTDVVIAFEPTQIKSVNNRGTFDPSDPNILRAGPRGDAKGGFIPETLTVLLNEKADVSTFLHESAHAFLTIYGDMAAQGDAQATADLTTLLDWFGVKDVATWNAMTLEQQRKHHEKFAYSFEGYLFDGVAPSEEMRGLFDRFKVWLRAIYKTIRDNIGAAYEKEFGEPLPILTGEVRQVMDRMLASEQTIAEAEAVRSMVPMFQTQEQYLAKGGTPDGYAAYQQMAQEAREAGVAELERRSLRAMEWLSGARGRLLKAAQAQHNAIRKRVRAEVVAEVKQNPRDQARRWLLRGELVQEDGNIGKEPKGTPHTMDRAAVEALVPGADLSKIDKMLSVGGLNPDQVAEALNTSLGSDFTSGEGLVRAMLEMRPFEEVVDARTDERMHAEHSDLADPAEVEAAVERALHNDARARFDAAGLRHLQGATQPVRVMLAAAKEAARQAISGMPLRDVSAKKFAQAEARAARKAMDAMKKGDSAEAAEWQQKRLLQHALSTVAGEVQQDVAKELRNISRFRKPDAKLAKSRNIDLVNAARWILSRYNLGTPNQAASATKALQAVAAYDANMGAQLAPLIADAEQNGRDYRDLSVDQFRDLMGKVDGLWNDSRRDQQIRLDGKLVEKAEARERIGEQLAKAAAKGRKPVSGLLRGIGGITASLRHVESWALEMDGGQPGPVHDLLFRMLRDRYDDYLLQRKEMAEALQDRIKELPNLYGRKYEARYLKDKNGVPHVWKDRAQVIGWVLHLGNLENARKDAVGRGWVVKAKDGTADLSPVFRELQRLIDEGHVTKADMQFVQGSVWDTYEHTLKPKAQAAHKDVYGYYFTEVDGSPLELRFPDGSTEKFRGGYAPAKPDPDLEEARPGQVSADGITESGAEFAGRHPSAPKGFTITRTGVDRALMHDLRMVPQSFAEELQFIHMQRAGKDLDALLNDKDIAAAIRAVDPDAIEAMFRPWLSDTMRDRLMAPGGNKVVNRALVALRRNVGMAHMFGNVANAFQQVTGLATAATYVPMKHLRAGARSMTQAGQIDRMKAASKFMRLRIDKRLGQITDDIDGALKTTWTGKAAGWTRRNAYFLQRWFQMPVDLITWFGAHDQAMAQGKTDAQAVAWADAAVRRSQGSGVAPDISRFERSSAPIRLLTQFGGFWLAQFNTLAQRHGAERATAAANVILFAGVTAGAISQALKGGWDDDDEDGQLWDDVLSWTFGETVRTGASLLPVIGPAAYVWTTGDRGGRASPMAVVSTMDQAARGFGTFAAMFDPERDVKGADIKATGLLLATFSAFPWFSALARPASYATDVQRGNVVPSGPGDAARGLLTGSVAPGTRQ